MTTAIKFRFGDDLRRFALPRTAGFQELRNKIASLTGTDAEDLTISYTDEEGDNVSLTTDGEVAELLTFHEIVRLNVAIKSSSKSSSRTSSSIVDVAATAALSSDNDEPQQTTETTEDNVTNVDVDPSSTVVIEDVNESDNESDDESDNDAEDDEDSSAAPTTPSAIAKSKQPELAEPVSASSSASASASAQPAQPAQPAHRTSGSIFEDLQALWATFVERNQDLFERAGELHEELSDAVQAEAEQRRRQFWEARRQALEEHARLQQQRREQCIEACKRRWAAGHQQQQQQQQQQQHCQRGSCGPASRGPACHPQQQEQQQQQQQKPEQHVRFQPDEQQRERIDRRQRNLVTLAELGFVDERLNNNLLERFHDSVGRVADYLFNAY